MDLAINNLFLELEEENELNENNITDRRHKLLNLERSTAELLHLLVLGFQRKRILEIGTSNGYSALWLALALQKIEGSQPLITIERESEKAISAQKNFAKAGLSEKVNVLEGDATEIITKLKGLFDCVFFDADRISASEQLHLLLPNLEQNVLLLTDNVLSHPEEVAPYLYEFKKLPNFITTVIPVGKGLHIAYRI